MLGFLGIVVGILLILIGGFLIFFFPGTEEHQPNSFAWLGILIGFILIAIGVVLIFL